jgi:hypothetical protein
MKTILRAITLTTAITLTGLAAASGWDITSTCWLTCFNLSSGATQYKSFGVTQADCCSGAALSCPAGGTPSYAWGEPANPCGLND